MEEFNIEFNIVNEYTKSLPVRRCKPFRIEDIMSPQYKQFCWDKMEPTLYMTIHNILKLVIQKL